jgi:hypothetical protein
MTEAAERAAVVTPESRGELIERSNLVQLLKRVLLK